MDYIPINFALLKNPLNYFIVLFMVVLAMIPATLIYERVKVTT